MGESYEHLLKVVRHCQESLDKYTEHRNDTKLLHYLEKLYRLPIKVIHLEQTGVGRTVNGLRKLGGDVGDSAKSLVAKWKEMVVGEQEEEDDEDEEEDDEDDEDGYQTGEEQSSDSDEKDSKDAKIKDTSSSHRKSDSNRTDDKNSESGHGSEKRKERDRHHKHNGHAKHKSHKRKSDDESSDDERPKKRPKKSDDEDRHKSRRNNESDSEVEVKHKEKKHKTEKHKEREKEEHTPSKSKDKHKESSSSKDKSKHSSNNNSSKKEDSKKHEHKKSKDKDKKSKHKEKHREKDPINKSLNTGLSLNGIDSGSGASFAEALGMCEPSSSSSSSNKHTTKKKSSDKRESSSEKKEKISAKTSEDPIPKLLKEPALEPIDLNLSSLLPAITPNYRPLGNLIGSDYQHKKIMSEAEALTSLTTSKNQRTKVYSGNKVSYGKVPSLFEICIRILQDNIDALEYTGGVPYNVLKPILEKANPNQLYMMEHHNPYLIEDTDELWQLHCQKEFRNKKREELETWREMYLRCLDERDAKLKALTANIKQSQDKSLPVRMTKLAYVDAVAKPPRNIARKQAKNGTAFDIRKPAMTPSARLNLLATAGEAGKVAVPNPGNRAVDRTSGHAAAKMKKAPLMLKSITSFKNRFKR